MGGNVSSPSVVAPPICETPAKIQRREEDYDTRPLAVKAFCIMMARYGLPKEAWNLCKDISDPKEQRVLRLSQLMSESDVAKMLAIQRFDIVGIEMNDNFNLPLSDEIPANVKSVKTGLSFNHPIILPPRVEVVYLRRSYNHPIALPTTVREFMKEGVYTHPLHLHEGLLDVDLVIDLPYDHPFVLPTSLKKLHSSVGGGAALPPNLESLTWYSSEDIGPLPHSLQELTVMDAEFNHLLDAPSTLRMLNLRETTFDHPLENLPAGLQEIHLSGSYRHPLSLPAGLRKAVLGMKKHYPHIINLPDGLKELYLEHSIQVQVPLSLVRLSFGSECNHFERVSLLTLPNLRFLHLDGACITPPLELPEGLEELHVPYSYLYPLQFSESLKRVELHVAVYYGQPIDLPIGLQELHVTENLAAVTLPPYLVKASFGCRFDQPLVLPLSMKDVYIQNSEYSHEIELPPGCRLDCAGDIVVAKTKKMIVRKRWVGEEVQ